MPEPLFQVGDVVKLTESGILLIPNLKENYIIDSIKWWSASSCYTCSLLHLDKFVVIDPYSNSQIEIFEKYLELVSRENSLLEQKIKTCSCDIVKLMISGCNCGGI